MVVGTPVCRGEEAGGLGWRVDGWLKVAEEEEVVVGCILAMG